MIFIFVLMNFIFDLKILFFFFLFFFFKFNFFISFLGMFLFFESLFMFVLVFMSLMILSLIFLSEFLFNLKFLSSLLVIVSLFFFLSSNFFFIYLFFEFSLFPILLMLLGYGYQIEKINAAYFLFIFTMFFSMPFFFFFINNWFYFDNFFFDFFYSWELFFFLTLMFMLKFPVYFLHFWLPKAHVEAPTTASMLLAGLLLKLGTGGFIRLLFSFKYFFLGSYFLLSLIGMILSNFMCIFQSDLKALAAFSSINHMSLVLLSLLFLSYVSILNSVVIMFSHGLISTLMFYFIGEFFHFSGVRLIYYYNSIFSSSLIYSILILLVRLYNSGVPFSLTFFSEFNIFLVGFNSSYFFFFYIFYIFFLTFYYCLYFISLNFLGKNFILMNYNLNIGLSLFMIVMMYNIFWLTMFF
uniref:NADH-ubiquinone oxidoreductase chain 4 n=1 Tax=Bursaphelenchus mucronatus TaxID=6325 RepID=M4GHL2_BURMU|nr:NADH dehydrogenase subunit 4 [Bursaphelenchus mucronatus]ACZ57371.1 NADH dehydrogenase subunit 4 [Bursaphelenchus mucronatus]